ncbi:MAG: 50S ribosomal protein L24e [archaeon]|nr:50S ribosomal protein L24e [archaeon]
MAKCSFCGNELERGTGKIFVKKEGSISFFCSRKCEKNLHKLGRNPQKVRWTEKYRKVKETLLKSKK